MTVRAFWVEAAGLGAIRSVQLVRPSTDEVLVRTLYSGISRGTESLVYRGNVPDNQYDVMRCPHQEGTFSFPIKYGYICVGIVESAGDLQGQPVFCLHPHQTQFVVPRVAVTPLPKGLDPGLAVLTANLETAVNGVWDANPVPGERVSVVGAGVVGILVAWRLHESTGLDVELVDVNPARSELARMLGLDFRSPANASADRDLIVHASGTEAGLQQALSMAAPDGRIIEMSWFGDRPVSLPLGEAFHSRRLTIRSSQVGQIPPRLRDEWDYSRRLELVLSLLRDHPELGALIDGESDFDDLPITMQQLVNVGGVLCHRIRYPEDAPCFV